MSKIKSIGIIAEDRSDTETISTLIKRTINKNNLKFRSIEGNGCGRIRHKAIDYATNLKKKGCDILIFIHDLDRNDYKELKSDLETKLKDNPFKKNHIICIPIEEIEAWFLSDPSGLKIAMKLKREPKVKGNPETISSPKEKLRDYIYSCSNKERIYINTKHNKVIADKIDLDTLKSKCKSFEKLYSFVTSYSY